MDNLVLLLVRKEIREMSKQWRYRSRNAIAATDWNEFHWIQDCLEQIDSSV